MRMGNDEKGSLAAVGRAPRAMLLSLALALLLTFLVVFGVSYRARAAGTLTINIVAGYNLVVDSNVESPSTYAPEVATVIGRFCNTGDQDLTGVQGYIGDYKGSPGASTPGLYPERYSTDAAFITQHPHLVPSTPVTYSFTHIGGRIGLADATRQIGTIAPGECKLQYWHFTYPRRGNPDNTGNAVWGVTHDPNDDLWLEFDVWGSSDQGSNANETRRMTMRNEISAMANKIEPEGGLGSDWFNTETNLVVPGGVITSNGVRYNLGNVRFGFDNDDDWVPDYNAWLQPIGDSSYDPSCFRLIHTSGVLTVSRGAGKPDLIITFDDYDDPHPIYGGPLYFTNLPPDNNGVIGNVYYTFQSLDGPCFTTLTPYQEVASGYDNEKFNGDYGAGIPPVGSAGPEVTVDKEGNVSIVPGSTMTYTIDLSNDGATPSGLPLSSMPLVISDTIPVSTTFVADSIAASVPYSIYYSTDGGQTYTTTQPAAGSVTNVQIWLADALAAGTSATMTFAVQVDPSFPLPGSDPFVENCAAASFGGAAPFDESCISTMVQGANSIGDYVWRDEDNDGVQDAGEVGIDGVTLSLYWDRNGDGALDDGDMLVATTSTGITTTGTYTFAGLPNGDFLVKVDVDDPDIPTGYRYTTPPVHAVTGLTATTSPYLLADFGFGPSLRVSKNLAGGAGYEGQDVVYNLTIRNLRPGGGETVGGGCRYTVWSGSGSTGGAPKNFASPSNAFGAIGPDDTYASGDFRTGANKWIMGSGNDVGVQGGSIVAVEARIYAYVNPALTNDYITLDMQDGGASLTTTNVTDFSSYVGVANAGLITWNVTANPPGGTWEWTDFTTLDLRIDEQKTGSGDTSVLYIDAIGFQVTSDSPCPAVDSSEVIANVPLTDTYNTTLLEFVSADPPESSIDTVNGVITWTNVGPIYPGSSKSVQVTFLGLEPSPQVGTTISNTACSTLPSFGDGKLANSGCATNTSPFTPTGLISGVVWSDFVTLGWDDPTAGYAGSDIFIPGATANLWQCVLPGAVKTNKSCTSVGHNDGVWVLVESQETGPDGGYLFDGLVEGYYTVSISPTLLPGTPSQSADPDDTSGVCGTCDSHWQDQTANMGDLKNLTLAEEITNINFGYTTLGAVYGTVWEDNDGDGVREDGENGLDNNLAGITVTLTNGVFSTTQTNADGYYEFADLVAGQYTITVDTSTLPPGGAWQQTDDPDATLDHEHTLVLATGEISGSFDFGYYRNSGPYLIGDTVYTDWNGDGDQDAGAGEEGLDGVTVTLYEDGDGDGIIDAGVDAFITSTTTSGGGVYTFTNLVTGTYIVIVDEGGLPAWDDYRETQDPDEAGVCVTCNSRGSGAVSATLTANRGLDYGYQPVGYGSIGDFVWKDDDGDGIQDVGETGISTITVKLFEDGNGNGVYDAGTDALVMTTTTDANGDYLFEYLPAGDYLVWVDEADGDLPTDDINDPYVLSTDNWHAVSLSTADEYVDADFGFTTSGRIGDLIWYDNDGNGEADPGEDGIPNVTVRLYDDVNGNGVYDAGTDVLSGTATTNASGIYTFTGVTSGTYVVVVDTGTLPGGLQQTGDPDLITPCSGATCDSQSGLALPAGRYNMSQDFGYKPLGVIGDAVWIDVDGDGVYSPTLEAGLANITVTLWSGGSSIMTTTTNSEGYYSFGNVADGSYTVQIDPTNLPAGLTLTYDPDEANPCSTCDAQGDVTISAVITEDLTIDFGYQYSGTLDVSGHVFFDAGNDGGFYTPPGDSPYENITVYLWNSDGLLIAITSTNATADYGFTGLVSGTYTVAINSGSAQLDGMTPTAAPGEAGVCSTCSSFYSVTVTDTDATDIDWGFYAQMDFGDLPDTYGVTLLADEGPYHTTGSLYLGGGVSAEGDGRESTQAISDTLDNGVDRHPDDLWVGGMTVQLTVTVTGSNGYLIGWIDWDGNGDFNGSGERIVFGDVPAGENTVDVAIPGSYATGSTLNARFRLYEGSPSAISPLGAATNGEVEDYQWEFGPTAIGLLELRAGGVLALAWLLAALGLGAAGLALAARRRQRAAVRCENRRDLM